MQQQKEVERLTGIELARKFYTECVYPILTKHFGSIFYDNSTLFSACLIGHGSEVLGFDTAMSEDHDFGPRVQIFLNSSEHVRIQYGVYNNCLYLILFFRQLN